MLWVGSMEAAVSIPRCILAQTPGVQGTALIAGIIETFRTFFGMFWGTLELIAWLARASE